MRAKRPDHSLHLNLERACGCQRCVSRAVPVRKDSLSLGRWGSITTVTMNRNHWIDNCPDCKEVLRQFYLKKAFIPEDATRNGWSGVEGYFCAGCDRLLIAVGFDA